MRTALTTCLFLYNNRYVEIVSLGSLNKRGTIFLKHTQKSSIITTIISLSDHPNGKNVIDSNNIEFVHAIK